MYVATNGKKDVIIANWIGKIFCQPKNHFFVVEHFMHTTYLHHALANFITHVQ